MTDYDKLAKALRYCSHDGLVKCNECEYGGKEWPVGCEEEMMRDAAAAYEHGYADGRDEAEAQLLKQGECVVRMEMPQDCCECQLRQEDYDTGEEFCPFTGVECLSIGIQDNCPIICQLPEGHGRLVDADKLSDDMKARKAFFGRMSDPQCLVEDAHTIVPAEAERSEK